ncbi:MAG TPA: hypothetical protein VLC46_25085 [Thermoanaerobaculia bacterium]|jgi:hypothetical protein|nr:hypothetical protein [Thermoanaerobaculia bacterium]
MATTFNVPDAYEHYPKLIIPGDDLILDDAHLKWYDIYRAEAVISEGVKREAREFLRYEAGSGRLNIAGDLGFVILHLCGESFFFLIVCTWRHTNELWETAYSKDTAEAGPFQLVPKAVTHRPAFCVWELGAVIHEQKAWTEYLYSARNEEARLAWIGDRFRGVA